MGGAVEREIGQRGRIVRRQRHGLAMRRQGLVVAPGLVIGHAQQRDGPPIPGTEHPGLAGRLDGVEALALADLAAGGLQQGLGVVGGGDQHPLHGGDGVVIAAHGAQGLGEADPGLGVGGIHIGLPRPERGPGQGIEARDLSPLLGRGLAARRGGWRRLGQAGGGFRGGRRRRGERGWSGGQGGEEGGCGEGRHATHERHGSGDLGRPCPPALKGSVKHKSAGADG